MKKPFRIISALIIMLMCFTCVSSALNEGEGEPSVNEAQQEATAQTPAPTEAPAPSEETQPAAAQTQSGQTAAKASSNAVLSSLQVVGITESGEIAEVSLSPEFNARTRTYTASVPFEVVRLEIKASADDSKARISIPSGYLTLDVGANKSFVYVTAQNGNRLTYQINTERAEEPVTVTEGALAVIETVSETEAVTEEAATVPFEDRIAVESDNTGLNKYTKLGIVFCVSGVLLVIIAVTVLLKKRRAVRED